MVKNKDEREDEDDIDDQDDDDADDTDGKKSGKDDDVDVDDDKKDDKKSDKGDDDDKIEIVEDERVDTGQKQAQRGNDESADEKRERRRREKQQKREKRLAAERRDKSRIQQQARENEALRQEMAELKKLVPQFQQRMASQEEMQIDSAMAEQQRVYQAALAQLNKSITEGNGAGAEQAQRYIDDSKSKYDRLAQLKQQVARQRTEVETADDGEEEAKKKGNGKLQETEMLRIYRNRWVAKNEWYDPDSDDDDSKMARAIDKQLIKEGFDPNNREFWTEFDDRLKEEIPHVFEEDKTKTKTQPRARQTNGSMGHDSYSGEAGKIKIPKRVVDMAKDAGLWDDPAKRKRFIHNWKLQNTSAG